MARYTTSGSVRLAWLAPVAKPELGFRLWGLAAAALTSACLWAVILKAVSTAFGYHLANSSIALAVAPIVPFLGLVLAPIMLRKPAHADTRGNLQDAVADDTVAALKAVHAKLDPAFIPRPLAASA